jgi:hypothetical protein
MRRRAPERASPRNRIRMLGRLSVASPATNIIAEISAELTPSVSWS